MNNFKSNQNRPLRPQVCNRNRQGLWIIAFSNIISAILVMPTLEMITSIFKFTHYAAAAL